MKVRIVVDDKLVIVDGRSAVFPDADWTRFEGSPDTPYDNVSAVWYDSEAGQGHVEFYEVVTKQASRPNIKPPDLMISTEDFQRDYSWVLEPFYAARGRIEAAEEADRAKKAKAAAAAAEAERVRVLESDSKAQAKEEVKVPIYDKIQELTDIIGQQAETIRLMKEKLGMAS